MAYNLKRTEEVREVLAHIPNVQEKKMFGSSAFMVNGKLCIGVGDHKDHAMMIRIDPHISDEALKRKGVRRAVMRGREYNGYLFLSEECLQTKKDLEYWVQLALEFNQKEKVVTK